MLTVIFFQNPISIAMGLIGASLPDFDHEIKINKVYKILIVGLLVFTILYFLKLPYFIGIIISLLGIIFYFSNHRGFTHSIFGIAILTILIFLIVIIGSSIILSSNILSTNPDQIAIGLVVLLLGILSLNKRLIMPFILLFLAGMIFFPLNIINYQIIAFPLFLGFLSHLILDSLTPAGIKIFRPFSSKKVRKKFAVVILAILLCLAIPNFIKLFNFFFNYF